MKTAFDYLKKSYINEKSTQELLPYAYDTITFLKSALPPYITHIKSIKNIIYKNICEQELERIKYFLSQYLIIRMKKIVKRMKIDENFLSEKEIEFYRNLMEMYKDIDIYVDKEYLFDEYIGFVSNVDNRKILLDNNEVVLKKGDFYICKLSDVREILFTDEIFLV